MQISTSPVIAVNMSSGQEPDEANSLKMCRRTGCGNKQLDMWPDIFHWKGNPPPSPPPTCRRYNCLKSCLLGQRGLVLLHVQQHRLNDRNEDHIVELNDVSCLSHLQKPTKSKLSTDYICPNFLRSDNANGGRWMDGITHNTQDVATRLNTQTYLELWKGLLQHNRPEDVGLHVALAPVMRQNLLEAHLTKPNGGSVSETKRRFAQTNPKLVLKSSACWKTCDPSYFTAMFPELLEKK